MRTLRLRLGLLGATLTLLGVLVASGAQARAEGESDYSKVQTYNGGLRYLRVDLGYEVVEKDPEAGYILFRYEAHARRGRPTHGSLEVVEVQDRVRLVIQLPEMPGYHEVALRDGLLKKLRSEYGEPPKRKKPQPKAPSDAGAD